MTIVKLVAIAIGFEILGRLFRGGGGICTSLEYWLDLLVTEFVRVNTTWSVHDLEEVRWLSSVTRGVMTIVQTVIFSYLAMT